MAVLFITAPAYAQGKVEVTVKKTVIYVCEDKVCLRPSKKIIEALKQINN
jgi:hypothetical protein